MTSVTVSTKYEKLYESIKDILQCPVCYLTPKKSGKIEVCINGHYICESCRIKITICPECRSDKLNFPSPLLKRLLNSLPMICSHSSRGCKETFDDEHNLEEHEPTCEFRTIDCFEIACKAKTILFKDLPDHLNEKHRKSNGDAKVTPVITDDDLKPNHGHIRHWTTSHHNFDGQTFFVTYHVKSEGIFEIECFLLGTSLLAREYICKISVKSEEDSNYAIDASVDAISIDDFNNEERKNWDRPGYVVVNAGMVKKLRNPENKRLTIRFEFKKREMQNSPQSQSDFDPVSGPLSQLELTETDEDEPENQSLINSLVNPKLNQLRVMPRRVQEQNFIDSKDELDLYS